MSAIQYYPGHMAVAMRKIGEALRLVDVVVEVLDARLPGASANTNLRALVGSKPTLTVLGREDLADPPSTAAWAAHLAAQGRTVITVNAKRTGDVNKVLAPLCALAQERGSARVMVVGIPNSGKSTLINGLLRRTAAKAEDRAGVTRSLQWFRIDPLIELMDTPGILLPKIEEPGAGWKLALTGALPRVRYDPEEIVELFTTWDAGGRYPTLEAFGRERGFLRKGGEVDWHNAAGAYLAELNAGTFGPFTLEPPPAS